MAPTVPRHKTLSVPEFGNPQQRMHHRVEIRWLLCTTSRLKLPSLEERDALRGGWASYHRVSGWARWLHGRQSLLLTVRERGCGPESPWHIVGRSTAWWGSEQGQGGGQILRGGAGGLPGTQVGSPAFDSHAASTRKCCLITGSAWGRVTGWLDHKREIKRHLTAIRLIDKFTIFVLDLEDFRLLQSWSSDRRGCRALLFSSDSHYQ